MIYQFEDPVNYLDMCLRERKRNEPGWTVECWAREMGLEKKNVLVDLLRRRRKLQLKHVPFLQRALQLDEKQLLYFKTLVKLSSVEHAEEKSYYRELLQFQRPKGLTPASQVTEDQELLSRWLTFALLNLVSLKGFREELLPDLFLEHVEKEEIDETLADLLRRGWLLRDEQGRLQRNTDWVTSPNDVSLKGVRNYYHQVSSLSQKAASLSVDEREFQCFALPIAMNDLPRLKQMIRKFRQELSQQASSPADEVYQANIQLFPLTQSERRVKESRKQPFNT